MVVFAIAAASLLMATGMDNCDPGSGMMPPWSCEFPLILGVGAFFGLPFLPFAVLTLWSLRGLNLGGYLFATLIGAAMAIIGGQTLIGPELNFTLMFAAAGGIYWLTYWTVLFLRCRLTVGGSAA